MKLFSSGKATGSETKIYKASDETTRIVTIVGDYMWRIPRQSTKKESLVH